jgi:signal transduction histidine kinase
MRPGGCEVADTGAGMSDEVRRRACEPFFTTRGRRGLAVSHSVIERHAAELVILSKPGRGTRVWLSIPVTSRGDAGAGAPAGDA